MSKTATFTFSENLTVFLPKEQRKHMPVFYSFFGKPTVKDAIEAQGVPHVEVAYITVNGQAVDFSFWLEKDVEVQVYAKAPAGATALIPPAPVPLAFVLDVHLGKLARLLRLLGFDAFYLNLHDDPEIIEKAVAENRIVLTRDVHLLKYGKLKHGYWLRSQQPEAQLKEVVERYNLLPQLKPFTRCMVCNHLLHPVPKEQVIHQLQPLTRRHFNEFYQCSHCGKVYWKGSHYENMQRFLSNFQESD
ncbi:MAG: Mut7-C ubiquitin/RNAse domain-containing protein [Hymenobacteraceae bacterium]|nr:Mut7-C ubiquitin/RNAse domain-containing protein [Hymenobacteraceae bacterium]MDX5396223.1 Mut7-C ubiquitin/RNAse domain-containing protein [Hymenobacteraceae bacterium]MDX5444177.1 Mut7-C ubiquitin/RNAse domain-containing protein [Hymenobacteraceae bacterium]MDX5512286.1 Mut7-C ubiquitin/RNAse domain-containing protein [Hymenobacteraceae bacterium]